MGACQPTPPKQLSKAIMHRRMVTASILRVVVSEPPFHVMRHTALLCVVRTYGRLLLSNEASHIILFPVVYMLPVGFIKPRLTDIFYCVDLWPTVDGSPYRLLGFHTKILRIPISGEGKGLVGGLYWQHWWTLTAAADVSKENGGCDTCSQACQRSCRKTCTASQLTEGITSYLSRWLR